MKFSTLFYSTFFYAKIYCLLIISQLLGGMIPTALGQEVPSQVTPNASQITVAEDRVYFADILVRGQPIFQVGSLAQISARQRSAIINRRLASLLAQSSIIESL